MFGLAPFSGVERLFAGSNVIKINDYINSLQIAVAGKTPMTVRQLAILVILYRANKEMDFGELINILGLNKSSMCRNFENLCIAGYASRHDNEEDRRRRRVGLTETGREFVKKVLG